MNQLQIALLIIGLLIVLFLVVQVLRFSKKHKRTIMKDTVETPSGATATGEPILDAVISQEAFIHHPKPSVVLPAIDPLIDAVAILKSDAGGFLIAGDTVLTAMPNAWRVGSKPFFVEAFNPTKQAWEFPLAGTRYSSVQTAIQLANRTGALTEIEFSEFVAKTQALADVLGMMPEFSDMKDEVAKAIELDQFAYTHDVQLSFTIRAQRALWSMGYLQQITSTLGFVTGSVHGRLVLPNPNNSHAFLLTLSFTPPTSAIGDEAESAIEQVVIQLDVPHVSRESTPYTTLCNITKELVSTMDGIIVDDDGRPITQEAMEKIGSDLEHLYDDLALRDLSAGSPQAKRLFS